MDLAGDMANYISSLKKIHIPDDCMPCAEMPKSANGLEHFVAIYKGQKYYVNKGGNKYARYVIRLFDNKGLVRFTIRVGEVFMTDYGEVVVEKVLPCTFPWDNDKEGVAYYCKKIVNK